MSVMLTLMPAAVAARMARTPSSSAIRHSSPEWISLRPIRSSQALWPSSFNLAAGFIEVPLLGVDAAALVEPPRDLAGDLLWRQVVGVRQRLLRGAGAEPV